MCKQSKSCLYAKEGTIKVCKLSEQELFTFNKLVTSFTLSDTCQL